MAVHTVLLDFTLQNNDTSIDILDSAFRQVLSNYLTDLSKVYEMDTSDGHIILYSAEKGVFVSVRLFSNGLVTANIEYFKAENDSPLFTYQKSGQLEGELAARLCTTRSFRLPPCRRTTLPTFFPSSDERILEYDIDKLVFEEVSPYQKVQIVHSKTLGNVLILDGLQNLSEKDLIYTETLMQRGVEDYTGKEIVILGGGDGALLYELLKEKPAFVTMFEIDDVVIQACRQHLRSCCGDVLDQLNGHNYEIVLGDCMEALARMVEGGKQVDYVFGDLTDAPLSSSPQQGETWQFIKHIISTSLSIIRPTGKYMTHCCGTSSPGVLQQFEDILGTLETPVSFTKSNAFVPSFLEDWVFYQLSKKQSS